MKPVPHALLEKRFFAKMTKDGPIPKHRPELGKCWLWTGTKSREKKPYGSMCIATTGKKRHFTVAHRISWKIHHGQIPENLKVLHKCDFGLCVNPAHLFLGTQLDNMQDALANGRMWTARGSLHKKAKLTEANVRWIRASKMSGRKTAEKFKVSFGLISNIRARRVWKHVC